MNIATCFVISYSPNEHGYEGVLAIRGSANGVKLYFNRGKELPDPAKLLQGSGNQTRWIDVEGASTLARPAGRAPDRRGHRSQSRAVRARRPRVGGHSFDSGQAAAAARPSEIACSLRLTACESRSMASSVPSTSQKSDPKEPS